VVSQTLQDDPILASLQVEREALIRLWNEGRIDDEVLRMLQRELYLVESRLHTGSMTILS
jgi:monovalent cation/hydrogen antiporter